MCSEGSVGTFWAKKREKYLFSKRNGGSFCLDGITKIMAFFVWGGVWAVSCLGGVWERI